MSYASFISRNDIICFVVCIVFIFPKITLPINQLNIKLICQLSRNDLEYFNSSILQFCKMVSNPDIILSAFGPALISTHLNLT